MAVALYTVTHPETGKEHSMQSLTSDQANYLTLQWAHEFETVDPATNLIFRRQTPGTSHPIDLRQEAGRPYRATDWKVEQGRLLITAWQAA